MSSSALETLFTSGFDLTGWNHIGGKDDYTYGGVSIPGLRQEVYCRHINGEEVSIGVFTFRGRPAYIAWGLKNETHCGFHAPLSTDNKIQEVRPSCPDVKSKKNGAEEVVGFILDGTETFE